MSNASTDMILSTDIKPTTEAQSQNKAAGLEKIFYFFKLLPSELRDMIWKASMRSGRVIQVHAGGKTRLSSLSTDEDSFPAPLEFSLSDYSFSRWRRNGNCHDFSSTNQVLSKSWVNTILSVCYESRQSALGELKTYEKCLTIDVVKDRLFFQRQPRTIHETEARAEFNNRQQPWYAKLLPHLYTPIPPTDITNDREIRIRPDIDIVYLSYTDDSFFDGSISITVDLEAIKILAFDVGWLDRIYSNLRRWKRQHTLCSLKQLILIVEHEFKPVEIVNYGSFSIAYKTREEELRTALTQRLKKHSAKIPEITFMKKEDLMALM